MLPRSQWGSVSHLVLLNVSAAVQVTDVDLGILDWLVRLCFVGTVLSGGHLRRYLGQNTLTKETNQYASSGSFVPILQHQSLLPVCSQAQCVADHLCSRKWLGLRMCALTCPLPIKISPKADDLYVSIRHCFKLL